MGRNHSDPLRPEDLEALALIKRQPGITAAELCREIRPRFPAGRVLTVQASDPAHPTGDDTRWGAALASQLIERDLVTAESDAGEPSRLYLTGEAEFLLEDLAREA